MAHVHVLYIELELRCTPGARHARGTRLVVVISFSIEVE